MRLLTLLTSLTIAMLALAAPAVDAQALDGAWFKVTANVKGLGLDQATDNVAKGGSKLVAYMHVRTAAIPPEGVTFHAYDFDLWTMATPGVFALSQSGQFTCAGERERLLIAIAPGPDNHGIELVLPVPIPGAAESVRVQFVAQTKIKLDKQGALKKATFKSIGCLVPEGSAEGLLVFGGGKVTGKTVPPEKLPFNPKA